MFPTFGADWSGEKVAGLGWPWVRVHVVDSTGSTNADLVEMARQGAPSGTALASAHQSAGRGRLDRRWQAPAGAAWAISVILRPAASVPLPRWSWLPLVAGVAVSDAVRECAGVPATVKWPNDVILDQTSVAPGKICGILAERVEAVDEQPAAVVLGIGVNTRLSRDDLPVPTASSLLLAGASVDDEVLIKAVLSSLGRWYDRWLAGEDLRDELRSRCATLGRQVCVQVTGAPDVVGEATDIDVDGRLLVRVGDQLRAFAAGDVVHLR